MGNASEERSSETYAFETLMLEVEPRSVAFAVIRPSRVPTLVERFSEDLATQRRPSTNEDSMQFPEFDVGLPVPAKRESASVSESDVSSCKRRLHDKGILWLGAVLPKADSQCLV